MSPDNENPSVDELLNAAREVSVKFAAALSTLVKQQKIDVDEVSALIDQYAKDRDARRWFNAGHFDMFGDPSSLLTVLDRMNREWTHVVTFQKKLADNKAERESFYLSFGNDEDGMNWSEFMIETEDGHSIVLDTSITGGPSTPKQTDKKQIAKYYIEDVLWNYDDGTWPNTNAEVVGGLLSGKEFKSIVDAKYDEFKDLMATYDKAEQERRQIEGERKVELVRDFLTQQGRDIEDEVRKDYPNANIGEKNSPDDLNYGMVTFAYNFIGENMTLVAKNERYWNDHGSRGAFAVYEFNGAYFFKEDIGLYGSYNFGPFDRCFSAMFNARIFSIGDKTTRITIKGKTIFSDGNWSLKGADLKEFLRSAFPEVDEEEISSLTLDDHRALVRPIAQGEPVKRKLNDEPEKREPEEFNITFLGIVGNGILMIGGWIIIYIIYSAIFN